MIQLKLGDFDVPLPAQRTMEQNNPIKLQEKFKKVFESSDGAEVLSYLMMRCHFSELSYVLGDPHHSAFQEGQRHVVNSILAFLLKTPEQLQKLYQPQENNDA